MRKSGDLAACLRELEEVCDRHYPGPRGLMPGVSVLLAAAIRRLSPTMGKNMAHERVIEFLNKMRKETIS